MDRLVVAISHQDVVHPTVIVSLELDDSGTAGGCAGEAECHLNRFCSCVAKNDAVRPSKSVQYLPRDYSFELVLASERTSSLNLVLNSCNDFRIAMAQDERSVSKRIVEVFV